MSTCIRGIGWLTKEGYGGVRSGLQRASENGEDSLSKKSIFSHPFKNFGRLDAISRTTAYAIALALQDAGIEYSPHRKQDVGMIGTNAEGSLRSDLEYFRDYMNSGRTLSRGNLFIYTLPSSPLGEAAIHFGLVGPLLYAAGADHSLASVLETASEMVLAGETPIMLAGKAEEDEAIFFVLEENSGSGKTVLCGLAETRPVVEADRDVAEMVRQLSALSKRKA